jgi:hypothetical protein
MARERANNWARRLYCGVTCRNKARQDRERAKYAKLKTDHRARLKAIKEKQTREKARAIEVCRREFK